MKVVYGMSLGTETSGQTSPITKKLIKLYVEGGPAIGPYQTLVLDATVRGKLLVKDLTPEDVQTGFTNEHAVDQQLERASNVTNTEEIIKMSTIPSYLIYDGFEKDFDSFIVNERILDSRETSYMHSHALFFLNS